jgi:hypothetical protein
VTAADQPSPLTTLGRLLDNSDGTATAALRSMAAKALIQRRWSRTPRADRNAATAAGRQAVWNRYLDAVDPDRTLPEDEREQLAHEAERAHMTELAALRTAARTARKAGEA